MPKIKMKSLEAGPKGVRQSGDVVSVDKKEAGELVKGGFAEYVDKPVKEEGEDDATKGDNRANKGTGKSDGSKKSRKD
jgi:hypothetical protein